MFKRSPIKTCHFFSFRFPFHMFLEVTVGRRDGAWIPVERTNGPRFAENFAENLAPRLSRRREGREGREGESWQDAFLWKRLERLGETLRSETTIYYIHRHLRLL